VAGGHAIGLQILRSLQQIFEFHPLIATDTRSRKAAVVKAVMAGLLTRDDAMKEYALSDDEFSEWENAISEHGEAALKATALQRYRS